MFILVSILNNWLHRVRERVSWSHLQNARDVAGTRAAVREFDDLCARRVRQRATVHERAAELVHAVVPCERSEVNTGE